MCDAASVLTAYEAERRQRIAANNAELQQLGCAPAALAELAEANCRRRKRAAPDAPPSGASEPARRSARIAGLAGLCRLGLQPCFMCRRAGGELQQRRDARRSRASHDICDWWRPARSRHECTGWSGRCCIRAARRRWEPQAPRLACSYPRARCCSSDSRPGCIWHRGADTHPGPDDGSSAAADGCGLGLRRLPRRAEGRRREAGVHLLAAGLPARVPPRVCCRPPVWPSVPRQRGRSAAAARLQVEVHGLRRCVCSLRARGQDRGSRAILPLWLLRGEGPPASLARW